MKIVQNKPFKITIQVLALLLGMTTVLYALAGDISTVAGTGFRRFSGDGGPATSAQLNDPSGVTVDGAGNLFIADQSNQRIRRVDGATGIVSTVAGTGTSGYSGDGGPATSAQLNDPSGVTVDGAGNIFIADTNNDRVRRVDGATGVISTVAGDGTDGFGGDGGAATSAQLNGPSIVAVDGAGNLFIADRYNNRIRRVDGATGTISTVAGNGTEGNGGDGGAATSAQLNRPHGVAVDGAGNIFIADYYNQRIRRVDGATGTISTVAGDGTSGDSGDGGPATSAQLSFPAGVAVDGDGNLFIADRFNDRIRRVDGTTGVISTVAGNGTSGFGGDGGAATSAQLWDPYGVAVDSAGNLFIADTGNYRIRMVDGATGIISTVAGNGICCFSGDGGPATSAQLNDPSGVTVDGAGNLFIADQSNQRIRRVDGATGTISTVAGNGTSGYSGDGGPATGAQLNGPYGIAVDGAGNLFIADQSSHRIRRVDGATDVISTVAGTGTSGYSGDGGPATSAQLNRPYGVAMDGAGNIFIADTDNLRIRRVDGATGTISTVAGNGTYGSGGDGGAATGAQLAYPRSVAVDSADNLFLADTGNYRIRKVDGTTGIISTVAGDGTRGDSGDGGPATDAQLLLPSGVDVDGDGNIFIADTGSQRIRRVDGATGIISTVAGNGTYGSGGDGGPATSAQLRYPRGVAVDSAGNLFIADGSNYRIRMVDGTQPTAVKIVQFSASDGSAFGAFIARIAAMFGQ